MSTFLVQRYIAELEKVKQFGGSTNESSLEQVFAKLLNEYCKQKGFQLVAKVTIKTASGKHIIPDGVIKDALRLDWGYWESKDEKDDIDDEIAAKFKKDYPKDNILFEDTKTAVLFQGGREWGRCSMSDPEALDKLLTQFVSFERPEVRDFRTAIERFKTDLPTVVESLREMIDEQAKTNKKFNAAQEAFWVLCKEVINPEISTEDIREMLIQHILTEDIFNTIFDETQFHRENNIAKELMKVEETFFVGQTKRDSLAGVKHYYDVINAAAARIADHHEKQKFLKVIYETFYKAYNPKAADRLGIVYTPGEIVKFMIESTDYLLHKHFGKSLGEKNVEILDPATGTGTFICDIIDYLPLSQLEYKYKNEIHANEVAILPYYIANLNIEYTYKQKTGSYKEFENICFVDTLDNVGFDFKGKQEGMFGLAAENAERIKRQNKKKISVIIGNPPYNANQANENDNNKNREYEQIDKRIKATYIKESTAQKTKLYDMYARFLRWASDRLDQNGVVAFVSNNSFINSRTYDGFRKCVAQEFTDIYVVNLKGDARTSGEQRRKEKGNVFSDQIRVGVAIYFLIRNDSEKGCKIHYNEIRDYAESEEKKAYLSGNKIQDLTFQKIQPDKKNNWINLADNDFESLLPIADKSTKSTKKKSDEKTIIKHYSLGANTARDEWVYDENPEDLKKKLLFLIDVYNRDVSKLSGKVEKNQIKDSIDYSFKWTRAVKNSLSKGNKFKYLDSEVIEVMYRPFVKRFLYFGKDLIEMPSHMRSLFPTGSKKDNIVIGTNGDNSPKPFSTLAFDCIQDYNALSPASAGIKCFPLYRYDSDGNRIDNITDWGLTQFREHYANKKITKEQIFHYVYGVLHNPAYRTKYELNLKREFPRIPFYDNFKQWCDWGKELMDLHINYETVKPAKLTVTTTKSKTPPKAKLKADKEHGIIILDDDTTITGIPVTAFEYKLGNRSALEWILDQYKEKTPKDPTIKEKFNTYKFADYKDHVIDLIKRVTTVSVRTVEIMKEMRP